MTFTEHQQYRDSINLLFGNAQRPPLDIVCADCHHRPGHESIAHNKGFGEDGVCVWPCNHEVRPSDPRCLACEPRNPNETDPWF